MQIVIQLLNSDYLSSSEVSYHMQRLINVKHDKMHKSKFIIQIHAQFNTCIVQIFNMHLKKSNSSEWNSIKISIHSSSCKLM